MQETNCVGRSSSSSSSSRISWKPSPPLLSPHAPFSPIFFPRKSEASFFMANLIPLPLSLFFFLLFCAYTEGGIHLWLPRLHFSAKPPQKDKFPAISPSKNIRSLFLRFFRNFWLSGKCMSGTGREIGCTTVNCAWWRRATSIAGCTPRTTKRNK